MGSKGKRPHKRQDISSIEHGPAPVPRQDEKRATDRPAEDKHVEHDDKNDASAKPVESPASESASDGNRKADAAKLEAVPTPKAEETPDSNDDDADVAADEDKASEPAQGEEASEDLEDSDSDADADAGSDDDSADEDDSEDVDDEDDSDDVDDDSDSDDEFVEETMYFPLPVPSFDEESGQAIGEQCYVQDVSRLGHIVPDDLAEQEIPIPHIGDEDGAGHYVPGEGKSRSKLRPVLALFLVAAMTACIAAAATYGLEVWGGKPVPNVRGASEEGAITQLQAAGFEVETKARVADDGIGKVISQEPFGGVRAQKGSTVTIVVAESRTIPQVIGLSRQEAIDLLSSAGAKEIEVATENSDKPEDTVLSVSPGEGEGFTARQAIRITLAKKIEVPDVAKQDVVTATSQIEKAGLKVDVHYVYEDGEQNTVVRSEPEAGSKLNPGAGVQLFVIEPMPSDPLHLLEYFGKTSPSVARYMQQRGFTLESSFSADNEAAAVYASPALGKLCFCSKPYSHTFVHSDNTGQDVLADGLVFAGVRWELPASAIPASASRLSEDAMTEIEKRCGLTGAKDRCSQHDIKMPDGIAKNDTKFLCVYGESGETCWTVLIANEANGGTRAVVTCAPISRYASNVDLRPYGDSICDFVACTDVYTDQ